METQQATPAKGRVKSSTGKAYTPPPMVNEIAAIGIGKFLTDASNSAEDKAKVKEVLNSFEKFNIVYEQNTADVVHIAVPDFAGLDTSMAQALKDADLEQVSGGELGISLFFGSIGVGLASVLGLNAVAAAGAGSVIAGALGAAVVIGSFGAAAGLAVAGAGLGVGIAAAVGAFDGNQAVNVGHNS